MSGIIYGVGAVVVQKGIEKRRKDQRKHIIIIIIIIIFSRFLNCNSFSVAINRYLI